MIRSRRLVHAAVGGVVALSCTVLTAPAQAAPEADEPAGTVRLVTEKRVTVDYPWAGASGFQYRPGTTAVTTVDFPDAVPPAHAGPDDLATGTDVVNTLDDRTVTQKHRSTGATATVAIPAGQAYRAAVGWSVLTMDGTGALHVLRSVDGTLTVDTPVTGFPAGARPVLYRTGGSVTRLAIVYALDGKTSVGLVDLSDGAFRTYVTGDEATPQLAFNDRWLVADWKAIRVDAGPGTEPIPLTRTDAQLEAVVGDQLLIGNPGFVLGGTEAALTARSLVTGASATVLPSSFGGIGPTLDGGALATAGPSSLDWNIHRVTPTGSGGVTTTEVARVPAAATGVQGLAVAGGELFLHGATPGASLRYSSFQLDATGRPDGTQTRRSPGLSPSVCLTGDAACPQLEALGDGRVSHLWTGETGGESVVNVGLDTSTVLSEPTDGDSRGRIGAGTGRYVLYNGGSGKQRVVDFPRGATAGETTLTRDRTAAAVWGQTLWAPGSTQGQVTGRNLKTGSTTTVTTGAPCTPTDIQAVNTWLYWSCGSSAGVYDRATGRRITVPADLGPARLADGFLLRENRTTHELLLTDFHTGTATTRTLVKLPATDQNTGGSNGRWAVDRFGGHIAYLNGTYGEVSIVPSGVPTSPLAQMEAQVYAPSVIGKAFPWAPVWQLNKPSTWTLTLTDAFGRPVRTLTGTSTGAAVRPAWDGTTDSGGGATGGPYTWKLTAHPRDGQGPGLTLSGSMNPG
ncbi:FlgD immunoglobulin-like domain containing protein [Streptomyces sp. A244]|uniref:FlgD immunoglobulin-like domain containing protein n=1 Tax=Streptomyces sp. A244 TaxID=2137016 RepID=UPI0015E6F084|nr:FlgD immunoglobulin-like domain containing protein [Streptomyces sp. A244]